MNTINGNTEVVDVNYLQEPAYTVVSTRALALKAINEFQHEVLDEDVIII